MDQRMESILSTGGMDVVNTVARFNGNEVLLLKYLRRFPADPSFAELESAVLKDLPNLAREACHKLKGVSGNLGLSPLYQACLVMMAELRVSDAPKMPAAFAQVQAAYLEALALVAAIDQ